MLKGNKVIGHRGAAAYAPENTLESFAKAQQLGCKYIEFDLKQSSDGEIFVFHDKLLNRTSNGTGKIADKSSQYIKSLDAGRWFAKEFAGTKIPTLVEAIHWLNEHNIYANIEVKPTIEKSSEIITSTLDILKKHWPQQSPLPLISSLDYKVLSICNELNPEYPKAWVLKSLPKDWLEPAKQINCIAINISKKLATKSLISQIIQNGFQANVFTINRRSLANKLFKLGVSQVFSDHPDLMEYINLKAYFKNLFRQTINLANYRERTVR